MVEGERIYFEKFQGHRCFACGTDNPIGFDLQFYRQGDFICSDITLGKYHEGWENVAHGGLLSVLLDEIMSWTIIYFKKLFVVTRKMNLKYVRPVMTGTPLTARGKLTAPLDYPKIGARGELRDSQGRLLVKGTGEFVELSEDDLAQVPDTVKNQRFSLLKTYG